MASAGLTLSEPSTRGERSEGVKWNCRWGRRGHDAASEGRRGRLLKADDMGVLFLPDEAGERAAIVREHRRTRWGRLQCQDACVPDDAGWL